MTGKDPLNINLKSCSGERNAVRAARCVREEVVVLPRGHGHPLHTAVSPTMWYQIIGEAVLNARFQEGTTNKRSVHTTYRLDVAID